MREDASWWSKWTYAYASPLIHSAVTEEICFEQYGDLPDYLKVKYEIKKLEDSMEYYLKKDPDSKNSVIKAVWDINKWWFLIFILGRLVETVCQMSTPVLIKELAEYLEADKPPEY